MKLIKFKILCFLCIHFVFISCTEDFELPEIDLVEFTHIGIKSAIIEGNISFPGSNKITEYGFCYNTLGMPTILDSKTVNQKGLLGDFQDSIVNLKAAKNYFIRAYAVTQDGISYSKEYEFKTGGNQPNIFNFRIKSNTPPNAVLRIRVNPNDVSTKVTFKYGTTTDYELGEIIAKTDLINNEEVTASIENLIGGQEYNVKVIAENELGVVESENLVFTSFELPEIDLVEFTHIGIKSAIIEGNISFTGSSKITEYGFCYNTLGMPTILDSKTVNQKDLLGDFQDSIVNLKAAKNYFIRAYAVTQDGISYSKEYEFKTGGSQPNIFNFRIKSNTPPNAVLRIRVNPNGLSTKVTFKYGTTTDYELSEIIAKTDLTSNEEVTASIENLIGGQEYNVKVIAENELGVVESENLVFTSFELPEIDLVEFTHIGIKSAIIEGNISFPGSSKITEYGFCYNTLGMPTILDSKTVNQKDLLGDFQNSIVNLKAAKNYFIRAYAATQDGISYSKEYEFKTGGNQPNIFNFSVKSNRPPNAVVRIRVNPNGVSTKVTFKYGTTTDYELGEIIANADLMNSEEVIAELNNLTVSQEYNVKVIAENEVGTVESENLVFNSSYVIGKELNGGIIAYIDDTGLHGFVRARNAISNQVGFGYTQSWGPRVETGATGIEIGDGKENTLKIEPFIEWASIVGNALFYEIEGNSDWYMASLKELEVIDQNLGLSGDFWSSSEYNADSVRSYNADTNERYIESKLANGYYQTGIAISYF